MSETLTDEQLLRLRTARAALAAPAASPDDTTHSSNDGE